MVAVRTALERFGERVPHLRDRGFGSVAHVDPSQPEPGAIEALDRFAQVAAEALDAAKRAPTLRLLDEVREAGYAGPVDVAKQRSGQFPGIHEIGFDSAADTIRISHTARNRVGFASGALKAARWIMGQRGIHGFSQVWDRLD